MRFGILSDVHSNLEALEAALKWLDGEKVDEIVCLGDVVGYGPNPNECCELVRENASVTLLGNHDAAVVGAMSTEYYYDAARVAIQWTRRQLSPENLEWLFQLPYTHRRESAGVSFFHSAPICPSGYFYVVFKDDAQAHLRMYEKLTKVSLLGHSHLVRAFRLSEGKAKEGMVSMFSSVGRPETNSPCETEFSLFTQKMIDLFFPDGLSEKELACRVLQYILYAYCAGRNFTPRKRLHHKTPAQAYADTRVPDEEKARVKEILKDLSRRVQEQAAADRRRCAPATLQLLTDSFPDLGLTDPKDTYIPSAATYGLDAASEAIAIFRAKKEAGTLPEDHHERYFLGITRNVAFRNEDQITYERLLDLRAKAGDLVLKPLVEHDADLRSSLAPSDYRAAALDLALCSQAAVDRVFWRRRLLAAFEELPVPQRPDVGRTIARRIANQTRIPHRERDHFISLVARTAVPLAA
ncbi:MAG: hypothetical protein FJ109_15195 [Deltaproteobacteria bacterium]|nr:hypothetical protein [Deltaproteobacteria bacterium]